MSEAPRHGGKLVVIATPIGNLQDISPRARMALEKADMVAAESVAHTRRLLSALGVRKPVRGFREEGKEEHAPFFIRLMKEARTVALVTDAGTPGVADPGPFLVQAAHGAGIPVEVIPGPSAALAAVMLAGFSTPFLHVMGFLPRGSRHRREFIARLGRYEGAQVLFLSPHRLDEELAELAAVAGEWPACLCKELTKQFEQAFRGTLNGVIETLPADRRGEWTLVLLAPEGNAREEKGAAAGDWRAELAALISGGLPVKGAAREIARKYRLPGQEVYLTGVKFRQGE
ncbi:MAG: Ribosomal RNA small subunit methyltransferase I [Myxococcota bacterium]|nr:Ribosomal RNA small subunit methyltransferase I [Myxococcota bacterium]